MINESLSLTITCMSLMCQATSPATQCFVSQRQMWGQKAYFNPFPGKTLIEATTFPYNSWQLSKGDLPISPYSQLKVKCILVQALRLCTGFTAHRGSRGITLLLLDHGTRRGSVVSVMPPPLFTPGEDPVPIVQGAGWFPGTVCRGA